MSYQRERETFIIAMQSEGMAPETARLIMRHANTVQRLAVAKCSGDWPCDNGERKVEFCAACESGYVPSALRGGVCPSCRARRLISAILIAMDTRKRKRFSPVFGGDPRGACVKLAVPSGRTDDGGQIGMCVPTRRY